MTVKAIGVSAVVLVLAFACPSTAMELDYVADRSMSTQLLSTVRTTWQQWVAPYTGHLAAIDLSIGTESPCQPTMLKLEIVLNEDIVIHEQTFQTTCDNCAATKRTCLLAPACPIEACQSWQSIQLSSPLPVEAGVVLKLQISHAGRRVARNVYISTSEAEIVRGAKSSFVQSSLIPDKQYAIRTFMLEAAPSGGSTNNNDDNENANGTSTSSTTSIVAAVVGSLIAVMVLVGLVYTGHRRRTRFRQTHISDNSSFGSLSTMSGSISSSDSSLPARAWALQSAGVYTPATQKKYVADSMPPDLIVDNTDDRDHVQEYRQITGEVLLPPASLDLSNATSSWQRRHTVHPSLVSDADEDWPTQPRVMFQRQSATTASSVLSRTIGVLPDNHHKEHEPAVATVAQVQVRERGISAWQYVSGLDDNDQGSAALAEQKSLANDVVASADLNSIHCDAEDDDMEFFLNQPGHLHSLDGVTLSEVEL